MGVRTVCFSLSEPLRLMFPVCSSHRAALTRTAGLAGQPHTKNHQRDRSQRLPIPSHTSSPKSSCSPTPVQTSSVQPQHHPPHVRSLPNIKPHLTPSGASATSPLLLCFCPPLPAPGHLSVGSAHSLF